MQLTTFPAAVRQRCLLFLVMFSVALLAGCGGMFAYREGVSLIEQNQPEAGLQKLEEAVRKEPRNAEYRLALTRQRAVQVAKWVAAGDMARKEGRLDEADAAYARALMLDPGAAQARQGLGAGAMLRRHRASLLDAESRLRQGGEAAQADALARVRAVLAENPWHKEALELKARIEAIAPPQRSSDLRLTEAFRKPVSLQFRDAPVRAVFDVIAIESGLNFVFDPEVRPDQKVTIVVRNTSVEEAVRMILTTSQLEQKVLGGNSVLIYPNSPQKQREYQTLVVRTFYVANADVKIIANTLKTIARIRDMVVDERLGLIIARDSPDAIRMADRLVALQDLSDPEVMLEVEIMEVKRSRLMELGVQWPNQLSLSPLQTPGAPLTLAQLRAINSNTTQVTVGSVAINAYRTDQDGTLLANPSIRVRNKEKAKVLIGDRVPVITTTSTSTGFVAESVNYLDVGLKLEVEPNVHLDEEVAIKVGLEVSSLTKEVTSKAGTLAYQVGTRGANTVLRLRDGETQVLAGLISDEERATANKLPGLGDLPILGRLFGSQKDDGQRSELLLSITPRILRSIRRQDLSVAEFESGTEASLGAPSLQMTTTTVSSDAQAPVPLQPPAAPTGAESAPANLNAPLTEMPVQ
ncbi:secretin and TonB N-terminal domain-containing protein [Rhodocyclus tenuis]|uniref:General secretion pathway protein D n=1 Tax=Rhodocyclus tenuis TaxID=1066 RepID=A0A840GCE6_RHOTE|nr:secretin and TonB N-terminal domain-containing protein [Rhodocyclus tenuis]MBB4249141.1 general secretion pathway protein D [Rhodocyclus tenuis]